MKKFLRKNKKYFFAATLILTIALNFFAPLTAFAKDAPEATAGGLITGFVASGILKVSGLLSSLIGALFGIIIRIEGLIIDYLLSPNFSFTRAPVVNIGWGITRDLANMFFILILLIIAFCTVLKIQSYAIKQLWWKVLVAALLINFSLVIAGFVIDFTQVMTTFFIKGITAGSGNVGTITTNMALNMKITSFYKPANPNTIGIGLLQFGSSSIAAIVGILLTLVGGVVMVFVFGATAIFLILRIINIWGLLIVAPIAWMLWILPATSRYFSQWWDNFIKWAFFAPIYTFFIYLATKIFDGAGNLADKTFIGGVIPQGWNANAPGVLSEASMPSAIFQWILVIAIMFYALIYAQKFGVEGAKYARETLGGWGTSSKNWAGRYARRKTVDWAQPLTEEEKAAAPPQGVGRRIGAAWRRAGAAIGGAAVAIPGARLGYQKMLAGQQKTYQDSYGRYKNMDPAILKQTLESGILLKPEDKMALQLLLIEKGKLKPKGPELIKILNQAKNYGQESTLLTSVIKEMDDDMHINQGYDEAIRTDLIKRAKLHNLDKAFRKFFPKLASKVFNWTADKFESEMKKIDNFADIYEDQLGIPDVVRAVPTERLNEFLRKASSKKKQIFKNIVDADFNALNIAEKNEINRIAAITHRDTRNRELSKYVNDLIRTGTTPQRANELSNLTRKKFAIDSQIWDTTI